MQGPWSIVIDKFEGFVPGFWKNANPTLGNKGHASDMNNVSLMDQNVLTQGPLLSLVVFTDTTDLLLKEDGDQILKEDGDGIIVGGCINSLIRGIQKISIDGTYVYATGGNLLYRISASEVIFASAWPHVIDKATVTGESGEDVCYYNGGYYYSYNHSGAAGDIGRYDGNTTFDDDYVSAALSGTGGVALVGGTDMPHQMIVGGDNKMYIANGRYIASLDTLTFVDKALDFPEGSVVKSLCWNNNRIYVAVVRPNISSSVYQESSIYTWDTNSKSWETQITIQGKVGGIFSRNGIVHLFYADSTTTDIFKLAIINGNQIQDLSSFTGSLPEYYQITEEKNQIIWASLGELWAWGAVTNEYSPRLFQYCSGPSGSTAGGISNIFNNLMAAFKVSTSYGLSNFSGYDVNSSWKSILFDVSDYEATSYVDNIVVWTEPLSTGARMDLSLTYNYGTFSDIHASSVSYDSTDPNKTRWVIDRNGIPIETFRVDLSWANGSATNPVKVRKIIIQGRYITDK